MWCRTEGYAKGIDPQVRIVVLLYYPSNSRLYFVYRLRNMVSKKSHLLRPVRIRSTGNITILDIGYSAQTPNGKALLLA